MKTYWKTITGKISVGTKVTELTRITVYEKPISVSIQIQLDDSILELYNSLNKCQQTELQLSVDSTVIESTDEVLKMLYKKVVKKE